MSAIDQVWRTERFARADRVQGRMPQLNIV